MRVLFTQRAYWRSSYIYFLLLLPMLILSGCPGGKDSGVVFGPTGTIHGYVFTDGDGQPLIGRAVADGTRAITGAVISVRGYPTLSTQSDDSGAFTLPHVPCGEQLLYVSYAGYARRGFSVTVIEGENVLPPESPLGIGRTVQCKWTILVYMAADNSLDEQALIDLNEMEKTAPLMGEANPQVKILVQADRASSTTDPWTDTRRFQIFRDTNMYKFTSPRLDNPPLGELDTGDPQTLHDFLIWGQTTAPAEHYLFILWNHGSGWDTDLDGIDAPAETAIGVDDTYQGPDASKDRTAIKDIDLTWALTGIDPIDVLAMDACLMSTLEVAYQVRQQADYLVASPEEVPVDGLDYTNTVNKLVTEAATITPAALASYLAKDAVASWKAVGYSQKLTCAAIDLAKIDAVSSAVDTLAARLIAISAANQRTLQGVRVSTKHYGRTATTSFCDINDYASRLTNYISDDQLHAAAAKVQSAVKTAVITRASTNDYTWTDGLSIYFPSRFLFTDGTCAQSYAALALAQDTAWNEWLTINP